MVSADWDFQRTKELIFRRVKKGHLEAVASLTSVIDRLDHARYHYGQITRPWADLLTRAQCSEELWRMLGFGATRDELEVLAQDRIARSANIVACTQALHSIPDTLAFAVFNCLEMPFPRGKSIDDVSVSSVSSWLKYHPEGRRFRSVFGELTGAPAYRHLAALSNHAKHRSIIGDRVSADLTGKDDTPIRLYFKEFSFKRRHYPRMEALPLLQGEFNRINKLVLTCGNHISAYLELRPDRDFATE